jgi:hypothetical protein
MYRWSIEWIGRGLRGHSSAIRLMVVVALVFGIFLFADAKDGHLTNLWWILPLPFVALLGAGYACWRFGQARRHAMRK